MLCRALEGLGVLEHLLKAINVKDSVAQTNFRIVQGSGEHEFIYEIPVSFVYIIYCDRILYTKTYIGHGVRGEYWYREERNYIIQVSITSPVPLHLKFKRHLYNWKTLEDRRF